ncbi:RHS repeat-associated core domain-containing protein [Streptomyces sp. NPDC089919]|uniref:RHS repeat-associated core domain-containing protein n=1 Tax=Streptomyces sp. NPDC089919 TaxID=3155188 RepID=UPI00343C4062
MRIGSPSRGTGPTRRRLPWARALVGSAAAFALLAPAAVAAGPPPGPEDTRLWSPRALDRLPSVGGRAAPPARPLPSGGDHAPKWRPGTPSWPAAGRASLLVGPGPAARSGASAAPRAGFPVTLAPAPAAAGTAVRRGAGGAGHRAAAAGATVDATLADRTTARRAGVQGLLVSLTPRDAKGVGRVRVGLDYTAVRAAYGGDWAARLRLVALPGCALTTPSLAHCRTRTPVPGAVNAVRAGTLRAEVDLAAAGPAASRQGGALLARAATVLAAEAAPEGSAGDYKATALSPTGSWSAGGNAGTFHWTYPVTVPPALGGTAPSVTLSYDSASVDGRTVSRNAQSSWIGDGWDYSPGYIERSYQSCKQDGKDNTGEACWSGKQPVTMALNGTQTALIQDDASRTWRTADGARTKVELATLPSGLSNGDNDGEYWKITTTDGIQYYFGAQTKPGTTTGPVSNATWTRPVHANNTGEPCYRSDFATSWCQQAWRWNLDYVVDTRAGLVSYTYATETNHYARNPDTAHPDGTLTPYTRGGVLTEIGYGSKLTDTTGPTAKVLFTSAERCDPTVDAAADCGAPPTTSTARAWPDVPFDQNCTATTAVKDCKHYAPTFWSTKRLAKITTQVLTGGTPSTVDEWTLSHEYPDPKDGTTPSLWLASVARTAHDGAAELSLPATDFAGQLMPNRVDSGQDNLSPLNRRRMTAVTTESGLRIAVDYAQPDCVPGQFPAPDANGKRCYPVYWNPSPGTPMDPTLDWFHKYVVAGISEVDATSAGADPSPTRTTRYEYVGPAAWHRDDGELTETKSRTWNDFRGYAEVIVRKGNTQARPTDKTTQASTVYLRGMDGDYKADGTRRSVSVPGTPTPDAAPLAGFVRETRTYTGDGGTVASSTVNDPWTGPVTARRARGGGLPELTGQAVRTARSTTTAGLSDGGTRTTAKTSTFDPDSAVVRTELDTATGLPDRCTTTSYASNAAAGILDLPIEQVSVTGDCSTAPGKDTTYAHTRTLYDGKPYGEIGPVGAATTAQVVDGYDGATPSHTLDTVTEYDAYGRPVKVTDPLGNPTSTAYTPASGGLPTRIAVTGPMGAGWTTTTDYATARNLPVKTTDLNNRVAELAYDPAGRLTKVWQPGRNRATQTASLEFGYALSRTGPSVVTTRTLRDDGKYQSAYQILDAFLQVRQTQEAPADESAGRVLTDTFYNSLGQVVKTNAAYWEKTTTPSGTRFLADDTQVPSQKGVFYDGQGRKTAETQSSHAAEQWRTTLSYAGADKVNTLPPAGGTATTVVNDARGKVQQLRQYTDRADLGSDDARTFTPTTYGYDARGQLAKATDAAGNAWTYAYDLLGRPTFLTDPDKGRTETHYDAVGRVAWTKDARGQVLHTTYDKLSRKTGLYKDAVTDANLQTSWSYDRLAKGQADGSTRYVGGRNGAAYTTEITALDTAYRPLGSKVTVPAAEGKLAGTYTSTTTYTPVTGKPVSVTLPGIGGLPAETVTTGLSATGLPVTLWSEEADYVNRTSYDPFGRVRRAVYGDVPKQLAYTPQFDEATGRLSATSLDRQTGPGDTQVTGSVDATTFTYKPSGDITSVATRRDEGPAGFTTDRQCFGYDHLQRMTQAWTDKGTTCASTPKASDVGGPAPYLQSYGFDVTGNRTKLVEHDPADTSGAKDATTTYASPAGGSARPHTVTSATTTGPGATVDASYTYDASGNTLTRPGGQTLTWDAENRLASNTGSTYLYDAEGTRLLRRDASKVTLYLGTDELTLTRSTGALTGTRTYAGPGGGPSIVRTPTSLTYEGTDHHGTASTSLDAGTLAITRRDTKPYGEPRGTAPSSWPDDKGFLGKPKDTTGLTHIGAREYDPSLGRFLSPDPVRDLTDPQQLHGYTYANASPVTKSDPTGLIWGIPCYETGDCAAPKGGTINDGGAGPDSVNNMPGSDAPAGLPSTSPPVQTGGRNLGCNSYCRDMLQMLKEKSATMDKDTKLAQELETYMLVRAGVQECEIDGSPGMRAGCMEKSDLPGQGDGIDELLGQWISGNGGEFVYVGKDTIVGQIAHSGAANKALNEVWYAQSRYGIEAGGPLDHTIGTGWKQFAKDVAGMLTHGHIGTSHPEDFLGSYNMVFQTVAVNPDSVQVAVGMYNATGIASLTHYLPNVNVGTPGATVTQHYFFTVTVNRTGVRLD